MTSFTDTWNAGFESVPPDTVEAASQGASRIRALKLAIRERVAVDHSIAGDSHDGKHKQVTLQVSAGDPTLDAGDGSVYTKAVAGVNELFMKDSAGRVIPLTLRGALAGWTTGDVKLTIKTVADAGWVLMDDKTIGNAASGATGRANADTVDLFTLLWNNIADAQCAVSGGRGGSAAADYAANKTIALPKALGRALATFGTGAGLTARVMAEILGTETHVLTTAQLPASGLSVPALSIPSLTVNIKGFTASGAGGLISLVDSTSSSLTKITNVTTPTNHTNVGTTDATSTGTGTTGNMGTGGSHPNMQPSLFLNTMIKL